MRHVYVHVPFCARRCSYCDFSIAVRRRIPAARFVDRVLAERALRSSDASFGGPAETLYFGGGTPSLLPPEELGRLLVAFSLAPAAEVTLEANPDDVTPERARAWVAAGVNRVSLGAQSFHPRVLAWMHRTHTADAIARAVAVLRAAGVGSVSADLIFALPAELEHDFGRDLDALLALEPDHCSIYGLSVEPRTPLARWVTRGTATPGTDERYATEFLLAHRVLAAADFEHYEVSNYARPDHRARHNGAYWTGAAYLGLGPSAHSLTPGVRRWNLSAWTRYDRVVGSGQDPIDGEERLHPEQIALEAAYLALRTAEGADAALAARLDQGMVDRGIAAGWLIRSGRGVRVTPEGWLRLDAIVPTLTTGAVGG